MNKKVKTKTEKMKELDKLSFKKLFKMFEKENRKKYEVKVIK
ncbi:hypothetical protein [Clostridium butyricum]|nr:hypothetical protein [Clostridium butyricum]